jgi:hypothetical protein
MGRTCEGETMLEGRVGEGRRFALAGIIPS